VASLPLSVRRLREDYALLTYSDLQGVVMALSPSLMRSFGISLERRVEVEDLLLQYAVGDLNINELQRFLLDLRGVL